MGKIFGYAHVATQDQNLDLQIDALEKAGAAVILQRENNRNEKRTPRMGATPKGYK